MARRCFAVFAFAATTLYTHFMETKPFLIVGLGEILWDLFPDAKQLGGAPANFAYMASLLE